MFFPSFLSVVSTLTASVPLVVLAPQPMVTSRQNELSPPMILAATIPDAASGRRGGNINVIDENIRYNIRSVPAPVPLPVPPTVAPPTVPVPSSTTPPDGLPLNKPDVPSVLGDGFSLQISGASLEIPIIQSPALEELSILGFVQPEPGLLLAPTPEASACLAKGGSCANREPDIPSGPYQLLERIVVLFQDQNLQPTTTPNQSGSSVTDPSVIDSSVTDISVTGLSSEVLGTVDTTDNNSSNRPVIGSPEGSSSDEPLPSTDEQTDVTEPLVADGDSTSQESSPSVASHSDSSHSDASQLNITDCQAQAHRFQPSQPAEAVQDFYYQLLNCYENNLAAAEAVQDPTLMVQSLNNLAIAHFVIGDYQKAIEVHQSQLESARSLGDKNQEGIALSGLGSAHAAVGDYEQAIALYSKGQSLISFAAFPKWYTLTKRNLGNAYYAIGDYGRALDLQEQSLTLSQNAREFYGVMQALGNIGNVTSAQGDFSRSIEAYEQCLKWSQQLGIPLEAAQAKLGLGNNYAFQGEYEKARDYYQQSLVLSQSLGSRLGEGIALTNLGEALSKLGLLVEAEAPLYEAIEVWESLRAGLGNSDDYKVSLFETQQRAYRNLQAVLITQNEDKQKRALEIAERGRARAFLELLAREDNPDTTSQGLRPQTLEELSAVANSQQATLVEYSILREQAVRRPHGASPQYSEVTELEVALLTWVIAADGNVTFHEQPISPQTPLNHWIETVRSSLGVRTRAATLTVESTRESNTDESLKQLYQLLIAPIQAQLPPDAAQRVVFIPQGELFLVPFPALMDANNNYLIEQHTVSTAPSIQVLDKIRSRSLDTGNRPEHNSASNTDILAVGNPMMPTIWNAQSNTTAQLSALAGAEQEAQTIASFFDTEALLGDQATEQAIKQRMTTARIVHLATHGLLEYGNPEESGVRDMPGAIALAPGNGDDGLLTSAEILDGLTLQAELVVLSACDTGLGTITGDGVIGLSRSLIAAGTPSVVVSLWAIPDAPTASLMTEFYAQMQQGKNKAQALRQAMLVTMESHPNPASWAAFTLVGEAK